MFQLTVENGNEMKNEPLGVLSHLISACFGMTYLRESYLRSVIRVQILSSYGAISLQESRAISSLASRDVIFSSVAHQHHQQLNTLKVDISYSLSVVAKSCSRASGIIFPLLSERRFLCCSLASLAKSGTKIFGYKRKETI